MGNRDYWVKGILLAVMLYLVVSLGQNVWELRRSQRRLTDAEARLKNLAEEEYRLSKYLQQVETESFMEAEIRNKLHLARPGERVLVLPEVGVEKEVLGVKSADLKPNWVRWGEDFGLLSKQD